MWKEVIYGEPRENLSVQGQTNSKLNPVLALGPGLEPGPQCRKESTLTTAPFPPSLHSRKAMTFPRVELRVCP